MMLWFCQLIIIKGKTKMTTAPSTACPTTKHHDKENQIETIELNFQQKSKPRPKTDRTTNSHSNMNSPASHSKFATLKNQHNEAALALLEKKKMYSMAIRQKNMHSHQNNDKTEKVRKNSEIITKENENKSAKNRNKSSGDILGVSNLSNLNISHLSQIQHQEAKTLKVHCQKVNLTKSQKKGGTPKNNLANLSSKNLWTQTSNLKQNKTQKQPCSKTKPRDKRQQSKHQLSSDTSTLQYKFKDSSISLISGTQNFMSPGQRVSQDLSMIEKVNDFSRIESFNDNQRDFIEFQEPNMKKHSKKLSSLSNPMNPIQKNRKIFLFPEIISISLGPFQVENQATKEVDLLRRQNNTFKKDLSMFRRDNGSLKRQIQELKKQLSVLSERNEFLEEREREQIQIMESMRMKMNQSIDMNSSISLASGQNSFVLPDREKEEKDSGLTPLVPVCSDDKLREILGTYENNLFEAMNQNKKLQFRNYMLQKKLMDSAQIHKKQMARQISVWKQRYIKARNENLRMKDNRSMMLLEMSISQDMSDHQ